MALYNKYKKLIKINLKIWKWTQLSINIENKYDFRFFFK